MKLLGFLNLKNISGQIAALVIASIVAIHLILTATFLIYRPDRLDPPIEHGNIQLVAVAQLLAAAPAADRPALFADIARAFPQLHIESLPLDATHVMDKPDGVILQTLHRRLSSAYRFVPLAPYEPHKIGIVLRDGAMISAKVLPDPGLRPFWIGPWATTFLFAVISLTLLGLWVARVLTAPLSSFAKAAESFSLNGAAPRCPNGALKKFAPSQRRSTGCGSGSRP
jgi:hypothetical protein